MVKPERRTRGDLIAALAIVAALAVAAALIWWTSDARATISRPAAAPIPDLPTADTVPSTLRELWSAPSPHTNRPVLAGNSVVTADGDSVHGRDAHTGAVLWSYARDRELCGVTSVYDYAVAVYPDQRGCGQVSTIDGDTGRRGPARSGYADAEITLSSDGATVLSAGDSRLELWRSDLIRMLSYGYLDAQIKPDVPTTPLCRLESAAASSSMVSVLEACPKHPDLRLTLLRVSDEEDVPELKYVELPGIAPDSGARVIAVSGTTTAVYLPTPTPVVNIVDETGTTVASTLVERSASPQATASRSDDLITWWTGESVLVFEADGLRYRYTVTPSAGDVALGPGTLLADRLLVPVTGGYDVFDPQTGAGQRHIPLSRTPQQSAVIPLAAGTAVLEQRGDTLVALGSE
ncbi:Rv3212 family protein [Mycolicibacterium thermoresistibile]